MTSISPRKSCRPGHGDSRRAVNVDTAQRTNNLGYMKMRSSKLVRFLALLCVAVWAVGPRAVAQTAAGLDIQLYAGLTITGAVSTVYQIQSQNNIAKLASMASFYAVARLQFR